MSHNTATERSKRSDKANFDHIYDQPEPRAYYTTLAGYDYQTPNHVQHVFGALLDERAQRDGRPPRVLDLACSYGISSALLRCADITFNGLAERYASPALQQMTPEEVIAADQAYFAERFREDAPVIYGCDIAENAVRYGEHAGLLERAWSVDLEVQPPDAGLRQALAEIDVVTVSSAIGYLTQRTFAAVLSNIPARRRPWLAAFSLRTAPIDPVAHVLRDHGLELATLTGRTVRQRRFVNQAEQDAAIEDIRRRGYVVDGHETDGYWHAALYVAMPADDEPLRMPALLED